MPAFDWETLPGDLQNLVSNRLLANQLMRRCTESQLETQKYLSLRTWNRRNKENQRSKPLSKREHLMHPSCVARLVCKLFAKKLRLLITSEVRVNRHLRIGGALIKTETVALQSIISLLFCTPIMLKSAVERERCKVFLITSWTARIAEAILRTKNPDPMAKHAYSALKHQIERALGNANPNTGASRNLNMRNVFAAIYNVLAVPVDYRSETAVLGPRQRRRRTLVNLITTAAGNP